MTTQSDGSNSIPVRTAQPGAALVASNESAESASVARVWRLVVRAEVEAGVLDTPTLTTRQVKDALMGRKHD